MNIGILIFPGVEILDFTGPFEAFSVATRVAQRDRKIQEVLFRAFFVAETSDVVSARYDLLVTPHYGFDDHPPIELLLIPGGIVDQPRSSPKTIEWIKRNAESAQLVTSVCTGAFLLAQAGILGGLKATTHWEDIADLRSEFPSVEVVDDQAWIDQGRVVTSAGIAAGIDMSLHLISRLQGHGLARATARQMVYHWQRDPARNFAAAGFA
ncbi:MAG: thiamine biosynthesis protein ThiJ [Gammaproteobacteria bacterium]|nr:thiamine biosynthesis protein ThiJ [Gammaproteobacteria bacterium]